MKIDSSLNKGTYNVILSGKFTFDDHLRFRDILKKIGENDIAEIILHMAGVTFVDSAALGMLLLASEEAKKHKKTIIMTGAIGQVKKMFEMAKFDALFLIKNNL